MARDGGGLVQGGVEPNAVGAALTALRKSEADKEKREQDSRTPNVDRDKERV